MEIDQPKYSRRSHAIRSQANGFQGAKKLIIPFSSVVQVRCRPPRQGAFTAGDVECWSDTLSTPKAKSMSISSLPDPITLSL